MKFCIWTPVALSMEVGTFTDCNRLNNCTTHALSSGSYYSRPASNCVLFAPFESPPSSVGLISSADTADTATQKICEDFMMPKNSAQSEDRLGKVLHQCVCGLYESYYTQVGNTTFLIYAAAN